MSSSLYLLALLCLGRNLLIEARREDPRGGLSGGVGGEDGK